MMKRAAILLLILIIPVFLLGCPGIGRMDKEAADKTISEIMTKYPEKVLEMKVYRDKLMMAFPKDLHPLEKSQIFMEAASIWWSSYPDGQKPGHRLYCFAYDDEISDDDIGGLQITRGISDSQPNISGQPGIYSLRDIK